MPTLKAFGHFVRIGETLACGPGEINDGLVVHATPKACASELMSEAPAEATKATRECNQNISARGPKAERN